MSDSRTHAPRHDAPPPELSDQARQPSAVRMTASEHLFAWRGDEVVLLVERAADAFVVARGWVYSDRLVAVRRWSFANPAGLSGQIRRLVRDATGNHAVADTVATSAREWAQDRT